MQTIVQRKKGLVMFWVLVAKVKVETSLKICDVVLRSCDYVQVMCPSPSRLEIPVTLLQQND